MALKIYNSLTKQKEEFRPLKEGEVKMYVCGPTVYDEPHIGHLRSAYVFDMMRRYLEYSGYKVAFVRNVTDVDDKIIEKARQNNPSDLLAEVKNVSEKYLLAYKKDLEALGIQEPTKEPKATEHVKDMIWLIEKLLKNGFAYEIQGDVYYNVNAFALYGRLSHQKKEEMQDSVRIDANEKKKNPLDFALWKKAKEGEPFWDSPWGRGRPGWHIECSAMSMKYLGETFDIHGGGRDLIFPHHENEIAQSEGVTSSQFARYWIHHGLITVNEQKMSKSLKNFVTLKNIREKYGEEGIEELKFLFLGTHYAAPLDYSENKMIMERSVRQRFLNLLDNKVVLNHEENRAIENLNLLVKKFTEAMSDDFNTPLSITILHEIVDLAWKSQPIDLPVITKEILKLSDILGLSFEEHISRDIELERDILKRQYEQADRSKDYKKKDEIRDIMLKKFHLKARDNKDGGPNWVRAS